MKSGFPGDPTGPAGGRARIPRPAAAPTIRQAFAGARPADSSTPKAAPAATRRAPFRRQARRDQPLAVLPELLFRATEILYTVDTLDGRAYREVAEALRSANAALEILRVNQLSRK